MATRSENMKRVNQLRYEKKRGPIEDIVKGLFAEEYKLGVGRWNISKIAKEVKCDRDTVARHLIDMGLHEKILRKKIKNLMV